MTQNKPSKTEEEYFAREEAERLEKQRTKTADLRKSAERATHFMKCPRCGADLSTSMFNQTEVNTCPECHGLWLDAGEMDAIIHRTGHESAIGSIFNDLMMTLRRGKKGS
jgi:uncharacterized protein